MCMFGLQLGEEYVVDLMYRRVRGFDRVVGRKDGGLRSLKEAVGERGDAGSVLALLTQLGLH